jgi:hypothetical protein
LQVFPVTVLSELARMPSTWSLVALIPQGSKPREIIKVNDAVTAYIPRTVTGMPQPQPVIDYGLEVREVNIAVIV